MKEFFEKIPLESEYYIDRDINELDKRLDDAKDFNWRKIPEFMWKILMDTCISGLRRKKKLFRKVLYLLFE